MAATAEHKCPDVPYEMARHAGKAAANAVRLKAESMSQV